ncbi:unnamed protein product [Rhizophagus irregularis]|uniref:MD-2-related lipid-recognition domain-containing protein n=1 Tax=Rhizophagus irregularis TaxID=588596 RepID=A0A915ZBN0_9GLOM|nr:unnamed protein product [Rhizophagus irregularis]
MSRIFILAFVLFATLFAVNAAPLELEKRETKFPPCPGLPPGAVGLDIKMTPDPAVIGAKETFDIKGTMEKDIVDKDWLGIGFIDLDEQKTHRTSPYFEYLCNTGVTCPIKAGTEFSTTQEYTAPGEFSARYAIVVAIGRGLPPDGESLACFSFIIGDSELSAVPVGLDVWDFL